MNSNKTEFIQFAVKNNLKKLNQYQLQVDGETVPKADCIKYLGVWLDQSLLFKKFVNKKCQVAMVNVLMIKNIRAFLTEDACKTLMSALVLSHLDYANVLLVGLPECDICKLQRIQNIAAKVTLKCSRLDSSTTCLKDLHWLPIRARIEYKIVSCV